MRRLALATLASLASLVPARAWANATATPDTVQILTASPDPDRLWINTTFGFLVTSDAGATWHWTCHEAITTASAAAPRTALSPDGALYAAVPLGLGPLATRPLWRSANDGCDWDSIASLDDLTVRTIVFSSDGGTAIAVGSSKTGDTGLAWKSTDGGLTFGAPILSVPGAVFNNAIFSSGVTIAGISTTAPLGDRSRLWRTFDLGMNWDEIPVPQGSQPPLYVLAAPDPGVIWVRNDSGATDRLLLSTNGGASFFEAFTIDADISGFALTQGGDARWLGVKRSNGLFAATAASPAFVERAGSPKVRCLEADGDVLYACADPYTDGLAAGRTLDGATWTTAMVFSRIQGPLSCPAGSDSQTFCDPLWPALATRLGLDSPTPTPTPTPGNGGDGEGCPCSTTSASSSATHGSLAGALLLASVILLRRRR